MMTRVGVNSGIEWELSSIPDPIPGIGLGIGIEIFIHVYFLSAIKRMSDHPFCNCSRILPDLC